MLNVYILNDDFQESMSFFDLSSSNIEIITRNKFRKEMILVNNLRRHNEIFDTILTKYHKV